MTTPELLKAQGKDFAELIESHGFDQAQFERTARDWEYRDDRAYLYRVENVPVFGFRDSDYYFMFVEVPVDQRNRMNTGEPFRAQWSPGSRELVTEKSGLD